MTTTPSLDTIVFDLDGTLVDSTADVTLALNSMLAAEGYPAVTKEEVADLLGEGSVALVASVIESTGRPVPTPAELERLTSRYLAEYAADPVRESELFPGAREALEALANAGVRLGVCTNKNEKLAIEVLQLLGIGDYFATVVGGDRLPVRKPHPEHLLAALAELGSQVETSGLVGDSIFDSRCAINAGATSFTVAWAPPEVEGLRLRDFSDLLNHIDIPTTTPAERTDIA